MRVDVIFDAISRDAPPLMRTMMRTAVPTALLIAAIVSPANISAHHRASPQSRAIHDRFDARDRLPKPPLLAMRELISSITDAIEDVRQPGNQVIRLVR